LGAGAIFQFIWASGSSAARRRKCLPISSLDLQLESFVLDGQNAGLENLVLVESNRKFWCGWIVERPLAGGGCVPIISGDGLEICDPIVE